MSAVLARRYARAFFDVAQRQKATVRFRSELEGMARAAGVCPDLLPVLADEEIAWAKREGIVDDLGRALAWSPSTANFLKLLIRKRRIGHLPAIVQAYGELVAEQERVVTAEVTTASAQVEPALLQMLEATLARRLQRTVILRTRVDARLLGGVVIRVGDEVYDGSVAAELRRVRERLVQV